MGKRESKPYIPHPSKEVREWFMFTALISMCFLQWKPKQNCSPSHPPGFKSKLIIIAVAKKCYMSGAQKTE